MLLKFLPNGRISCTPIEIVKKRRLLTHQLSCPVFCVVSQARPTFAKKWKWVWLARLFSVEGKMASTLYVHPRKQDLLNGSFVTSREQKQYCKIPTILPLSSRSMDRLTLNNRRGWIQGHSRLIFSFWSSARVCLSWFHS